MGPCLYLEFCVQGVCSARFDIGALGGISKLGHALGSAAFSSKLFKDMPKQATAL